MARVDEPLSDAKLRCEILKLEHETAEILGRLESQKSRGERAKRWAELLLPFLSVVSASVAIMVSVISLGDNLAAEKRRELKFTVSPQLVELTKTLQSSQASAADKAGATLLLANFEEFAVPILIANIENLDVEIRYVAEALRRITSPDPFSEPRSWLGCFWQESFRSSNVDAITATVLTSLVERLQLSVERWGTVPEEDLERPIKTSERFVEVLGHIAQGRSDERALEALRSVEMKLAAMNFTSGSADAQAMESAVKMALIRAGAPAHRCAGARE